MENPIPGPGQSTPVYDYRLYDRIWQRVSPELDPYPEIRSAAAAEQSPPPAVPAQMPQPPGGPPTGGGSLAGAEMGACCMSTAAGQDLAVLEGFIEEELAERQYCLTMARRVRSNAAARLMCRIAVEKQTAARRLRAAYFLITGQCYTPSVAVEPIRFNCLADALRSCYHQEACGGFNYQRAADGTTDICLQKLLQELSAQSYARADSIMAFLEKILR